MAQRVPKGREAALSDGDEGVLLCFTVSPLTPQAWIVFGVAQARSAGQVIVAHRREVQWATATYRSRACASAKGHRLRANLWPWRLSSCRHAGRPTRSERSRISGPSPPSVDFPSAAPSLPLWTPGMEHARGARPQAGPAGTGSTHGASDCRLLDALGAHLCHCHLRRVEHVVSDR